MGAVYEAVHLGTQRRVAVKLIGGDSVAAKPEVVERFRREAMASGAIESHYIAHVLDAGTDPASGSPFMVMELLTGDDLEHTLSRLGALPPDLVLRMGAQVCLGLQKAHEKGVIHRDIKPANLFLSRRDGDDLVVKILDFGIAKVMEDQQSGVDPKSLTRTGTMIGSPLYMAPEQALGKKTTDQRADVWSLGVVLYQALTGATPHADAETIGALIMAICQEAPKPLQSLAPWVPPEVAAIVHKALALDPSQRFQSAQEMYQAIRARLPNGHSLEQTMLTGISNDARAVVAPKLELPSGLRKPSDSMQNIVPPTGSSSAPPASGVTALEGARTYRPDQGTQKSGRALFVVGAVGGLVAIVSLAVIVMSSGGHGASGTSASVVEPHPPAMSSPSSGAAAPLAAGPLPSAAASTPTAPAPVEILAPGPSAVALPSASGDTPRAAARSTPVAPSVPAKARTAAPAATGKTAAAPTIDLSSVR
jgi:serine/threonine-protein kinase